MTPRSIVIILLALLATPAAARPKSRAELARGLNLVRESLTQPVGNPSDGEFRGMHKHEVRALIGAPDDIVREREVRSSWHPPQFDWLNGGGEIWSYGTSGHRTFPTVGWVQFDRFGVARRVGGAFGAPSGLEDISEGVVRANLRLINDLHYSIFGEPEDPAPLIRAVNSLQPLGKKRILALIQECSRISGFFRNPIEGAGGDSVPLLVLTSVLFPAREGKPGPWHAVVVDGIPLVPPYHGGFGGWIGLDEEGLERLRREGVLRAQPLRPTDAPLHVAERLTPDAGWTPGYRQDVLNQLLKLVHTVYRPKLAQMPGSNATYFAGDDAAWRAFEAAVDGLKIHWDQQKNAYTFADGSTLPPEAPAPKPRYHPHEWRARLPDAAMILFFCRTSPVDLELSIDFDYQSLDGALRLRAFKKGPGGQHVELLNSRLQQQNWPSLVRLRADDELQFELSSGDRRVVSPVFRP